jgi:hypothetical protein
VSRFDARAEAHRAHQTHGNPEPEPPWPEPDMSVAKKDIHPPPPWPVGVLPPFWDAWSKSAAETAGAPVSFLGLATMTTAGALLGNARWGSPWPGWAHPSAINGSLVGRPSSGKSPAVQRLVNMLVEIEGRLNTDIKERMRQFEQDTIISKNARAKQPACVLEPLLAGLEPFGRCLWPSVAIRTQLPDG